MKQWPHGRQKAQSCGAFAHIAGAFAHEGVGLTPQWTYGTHAAYGMHAEHEEVGSDAHEARTTCVCHAIWSAGVPTPG